MTEFLFLRGAIKTPRAYYGNAEEGVLIMENLKLQGFSIQDKRDGQFVFF